MPKLKCPIESIIGEKVISYKLTPPKDTTNGNLVLKFESGKKLFISSARDLSSEFGTILFFSPRDENATTIKLLKGE